MHLRDVWYDMTDPQRAALAASVGVSVGYLYLVVRGHRHASPALSQRLVEADPRLTLPGMRPDVYAPQPNSAP